MIVYVESNFILELAALQEEYLYCQEILELAETAAVQLVLPSFSVAEPFDVVRRRSSERRSLQNEVGKHLRLLSRTATYEEQMKHATEVTALLIESGRVETERLHETLSRIVEVAEIIPVTAQTLRKALDAQRTLGLSPQDSVVFASISEHLADAPAGPKCFLERDAKDFMTSDVIREFQQHDCRIISSFGAGLGFIQSALKK